MSAEPDDRHSPTYCYLVEGRADPGLMSRVLEQFAKRGLVPDQWRSIVAGRQADELHIDIQVRGLSPETAEHIARCLRMLVGVATVLTSEKRYARTA